MPLARSHYPSSPQASFQIPFFIPLCKSEGQYLSQDLKQQLSQYKETCLLSVEKFQQCVHLKSITVKIYTFGDTSFRRFLFLDIQFCRSLIASPKKSLCLS